MPVTILNDEDQEIYLNLIEKYNLYSVDDTVHETTFRGIKARSLDVSINKTSLKEFEKEASSRLSKDAKFRKSSSDFLENIFGGRKNLIASAFLSTTEDKIIGVEFDIKLKDPTVESKFGTEMKNIKVSVLYDRSRKLNIEPPQDAITPAQFKSLLQ